MGLDETAKVNGEYEISINVFSDFEAQISATMTVGELIPDLMAFNIATYLWTAPETPGEVMLTVDAIVNGEKFSAIKTFVVTENDPPIIDDLLVNQNSIDQDQFLILNAHELYDFEIKTTDSDGDELEIYWCFEPLDFGEVGLELIGSKVEYSANEAGLTFCYTSVDDKISPIVENQIYIIFEDGSESEITDPAKVATIEMILNEFAFAFEQNDLERILNYAHPDTKDTLRNDLEEDILYADCDTMDQIDRYLITFDPSSSIYTTYVLFKVHIGTITANDMWPLFFKADNNGEIKLYEVW